MMRMQPRTVRLGDRSWLVRPLTLAQVQAIEPLLAGTETAGTIRAAVAILEVALSRDHADTLRDLATVEAGAPEIATAMAAVLRLGGFLPNDEETGDAASGEAGAGQAPRETWPASTGPLSTDA